ncbi:glycosyltransferase [Xenorhabdus bovienii]|uniref:glycosyltransferase n=1 Tax=Xenorhabdus bovienii TaxID=40576 RepID=UPI0023B2C8CF|nr:glycosyltransferase [Xenorhabdus bovienii]MDE9563762.1 glycosyltransferase [Xenorhabdus bovienii]
MKILIVATAATENGALKILEQMVNAINKNKKYHLTIILNKKVKLSSDLSRNHQIIYLDTKSWIKRIYFDFYGFNKLINKKIRKKYDLCINLQNIPIRVKNLKQIVYYHQALPFCDIKFSIIRKKEIKLWLYKNFYSLFLKMNIKFAFSFIFQTNWIKNAFIKKFNVNTTMKVIKPDIELPFDISRNMPDTDHNLLFYPASPFIYKNQSILIEALSLLNKEFLDKNKIKLILTIEKSDLNLNRHKDIIKNYDNYIEFTGKLNINQVFSYYSKSKIILFPSKLETFGLPLLEAAKFKKSIICSDLPYAREVLEGYNDSCFCNPNIPNEWANAIQQHFLYKEKKANELSYSSGWNDFIAYLDNAIN